MDRQDTILEWRFPLPRTHTGVLVGNGLQGLMVWGTDRLIVTVGRAGFWDRRGGSKGVLNVTFEQLRAWLEAGDAAAVGSAFSPDQSDEPSEPFQIGGGQVELSFPNGLIPDRALLRLAAAELLIELTSPTGRHESLTITQSPTLETFWIQLGSLADDTVVTVRPTWEFVGPQLSRIGYDPPETWDDEHTLGFVQRTPADQSLTLTAARRRDGLTVTTALGEKAETNTWTSESDPDPEAQKRAREAWWADYWDSVPDVRLPDPVLQRVWDYGLYKQAGLTTPHAPAATLQGAWMESYQLPPWSNDYHFNINLQMIYGPALSTNRLEHFRPLWSMIEEWMPTLQAYGEHFFQAPGVVMLPHAVDDTGRVVGRFWTGTIDHACTAWTALLAWQYYRYSFDESILPRIVWPLLYGAFEGFWAMREEVNADGVSSLSLPVSVSPEFREAKMTAWGRDSSFQLAAFRAIAETLPRVARIMEKEIDPRWHRVLDELPHYSLYPGSQAVDRRPAGDWNPVPRIALWRDQDLVESHRHHSHLAAIYPFCSIDPLSSEHRQVVANSLRHWARMGAGAWTGWSLPWASIICTRCGLVDAAIAWLHWWSDVYVNRGGGTLHNADFAGVSIWSDGGYGMLAGERSDRTPEVMQMDAGMGALSAIVEILVHFRGDEVYVLPSIPQSWDRVSFTGIRTAGAFLVSAEVSERRLTRITVTSKHGGELKLVHGMTGRWIAHVAQRDTSDERARFIRGEGPRLEARIGAGEVLLMTPDS